MELKKAISDLRSQLSDVNEVISALERLTVVTSEVTGTTHTLTSTKDLETGVENARIYAGLHYHHSVVQGAVLGMKVADQVSGNYFQPLEK